MKIIRIKEINYKANYKEYDNIKSILGNDASKTLEEFQELKYNNIDRWNELKSRFRVQEYNTNNKDTRVDWRQINTAEYKKEFDGIGNNKAVDNNIYKYTKQILHHRENTLYEDLYAIDKDTGKIIAFETNSKIPKQINFSNDTVEKIMGYEGKLILVHNHPKSSTFSPADINLLTNADSIDTIISCGHDGGVHIARGLRKKFNIAQEFKKEYTRYRMSGFTDFTSREKAWKDLSIIHDFKFEER